MNIQEEFMEMLERDKERLFRICRAYTDSYADAQDMLQEGLLEAWKALLRFEGRAALGTWVYRIVLNVCLSRRRSKKRSDIHVVHLEGLEVADVPIAENEYSERYKKLRKCLLKLTDIERSVVLLFLEDIPYKQISEITGMTENHVAVKIKRIKNKLSHCINAQ